MLPLRWAQLAWQEDAGDELPPAGVHVVEVEILHDGDVHHLVRDEERDVQEEEEEDAVTVVARAAAWGAACRWPCRCTVPWPSRRRRTFAPDRPRRRGGRSRRPYPRAPRREARPRPARAPGTDPSPRFGARAVAARAEEAPSRDGPRTGERADAALWRADARTHAPRRRAWARRIAREAPREARPNERASSHPVSTRARLCARANADRREDDAMLRRDREVHQNCSSRQPVNITGSPLGTTGVGGTVWFRSNWKPYVRGRRSPHDVLYDDRCYTFLTLFAMSRANTPPPSSRLRSARRRRRRVPKHARGRFRRRRRRVPQPTRRRRWRCGRIP